MISVLSRESLSDLRYNIEKKTFGFALDIC
jgi:hypothetical protein